MQRDHITKSKTEAAGRNHAVFAAAFASALALALFPQTSWACACGCGVFEVGAGSMRPSGAGGTAYLEYDFSDQNHNWSGASSAPAADNADKEIRTNFFTAGAQYMFNRSWGVMVEAPIWQRRFRTEDEITGDPVTFNQTQLGDVRLMGVYSGFSPDMSTGVIFGLKLPTGDYSVTGFDRDTAIGSGSTDLLLGAYHQGSLCSTGHFAYFVQGLWDRPIAHQGGYTPGQEFDGAFGIYFSGFSTAQGHVRIAPVLQLIASARARDTGSEANPGDSGYSRLLLSPGIEFDSDDWRFYADVEFPIYQHVNGEQLVAPELFKVVLSRNF
jgi:hypothetical protein